MLVVPCRRLAHLLPPVQRSASSPSSSPLQNQSPLKRTQKKESVHGNMSHRKLLKLGSTIAGVTASSHLPAVTKAAADTSTRECAGDEGIRGDTANGGIDPVKMMMIDDLDCTDVSERLSDVLDSMYQATGPAGILLLAGVTRRRTSCGRYDVNTVALQHEQLTAGNSNSPSLISNVPVHQVLFQAAEVGLLLDPSGCFVAPSLADDDAAITATATSSGVVSSSSSSSSSWSSSLVARAARGVMIGRFCRTGYSIRRARPEDIDALVAVEKTNWGGKCDMCTSRSTIEDRVNNNPDCNLVVQADDGEGNNARRGYMCDCDTLVAGNTPRRNNRICLYIDSSSSKKK